MGNVCSFAPDPHLGLVMTIKEIQILEALIWRKCVHQCTRHLERVLDLHVSLQLIKDTLPHPHVDSTNMEASNAGLSAACYYDFLQTAPFLVAVRCLTSI